jgi:hypothetical protein
MGNSEKCVICNLFFLSGRFELRRTQGYPSECRTRVRTSYFEFTLKINRGNFWREISVLKRNHTTRNLGIKRTVSVAHVLDIDEY